MLAGSGYLVICLFFGIAGAVVARIKGGSQITWFLISACVPFIGLLTAVLYRYDDRELRRRCPSCSRVVKLHDAVCMHCGHELEFPEVAIASEAAMQGR
jgi:peptidoglycan/LPS O-acetylase OafA/YrhL